MIWYEINSTSQDVECSLEQINMKFTFFIQKNDLNKSKTTKLNFTVKSGSKLRLVWNILWTKWWISWTWTFNYNENKSLKNLIHQKNFSFENMKILDFLNSSDDNIVLYNTSNDIVKYDLKTRRSIRKI